jgi:hypothetical protein
MTLYRERVTISAYATKPGDPVTTRRSWRNRLLSWPWRPWVATTTHTPMVPAAYRTPQGWVIHPALEYELLRLTAQKGHR